MEREEFLTLGDVVPKAFVVRKSQWTVRARLAVAAAIATQLRCREELVRSERAGVEGVVTASRMKIGKKWADPLGDDVLRAQPEDVLTLLAEHRVAHDLSRRMGDEYWTGLRATYGYSSEDWKKRPTDGKPPRRVVLRIGVCLAADATFAPYARGVLDAIATVGASLRIDVRTVARAIWNWARDHPALSRSLSVARTDIDGETQMGFDPFALLMERVLGHHLLDTTFEEEGLVEEIETAADALGRVATTATAEAAIAGRVPDTVYTFMIDLLAEMHPDWLPEHADEDAEEEFARGAAPLVLAGLVGQRRPEDVADDLEALARAMRAARTEGLDGA